jgi:hypothetical protein
MTSPLAQLRQDFPLYARAALRIRTKTGAIERFVLNEAQLYLHASIEDMLRRKGFSRKLVLKGRQQGVSTYFTGRYYWRASGSRGLKVGILTHLDDATKNLFEMVRRYHDLCPPELRPSTKANSANELTFDKLDSGYKVATAGSKGAGRSSTLQLFHGSEAAFWPNAEEHMMGLGQTVPTLDGTEAALETTANGMGGMFHRMWQDAVRGIGDYEPVFIPWFWQREYRRAPTPGFILTEEEDQLMELHDLTIEQIAWRRAKIETDFGGDTDRFRQEYPCTAEEAFVMVGADSFIKSPSILAARRATLREPVGALVIGVDPARFGDASTCIARRIGRKALKIESIKKQDTMHVAGRIALIIKDERPARVFIDVGGLGAGIVDRLVELGFGKVVEAVNFGEAATQDDRYYNKRAEMWGEMRDWIKDRGVLPDDEVLHADLIGPQYKYDSRGRVKLETKEEMRKRGIASPDRADSLALTFAAPVQSTDVSTERWRDKLRARAGSTGSPMAS